MMWFTWFITLISLTGTALNVRKNIWCFYLWTFGNSCWLSFDLWQGLYSRALLDFVQLRSLLHSQRLWVMTTQWRKQPG